MHFCSTRSKQVAKIPCYSSREATASILAHVDRGSFKLRTSRSVAGMICETYAADGRSSTVLPNPDRPVARPRCPSGTAVLVVIGRRIVPDPGPARARAGCHMNLRCARLHSAPVDHAAHPPRSDGSPAGRPTVEEISRVATIRCSAPACVCGAS
jgi:hypothetical protein